MATLLSISDGNMTSASTWGVIEPTSFQGTPTTATTNTMATVNQFTGTAFTLASAVTVSGIALQISGRVTSPSGTFNAQLYNVTSATIVGQVTINVADLPNSNGVGSNHIDWVYFKFGSPITTTAGNSYAIRFNTSVTSQVSIYYTTTTSNINRALITTTTQAPVTGDALIVAGNYTSAGVNTSVTVTMNDTGTITPSSLWVSPKGTLTFSTSGVSGATLLVAGNIVIGVGGSLIIGTVSLPIVTTAQLTIICTTALQYSIFVYGAMTTYGAVKTVASKLASDVSIGATSSVTTTSTGWKSGDVIVFPSTTRTYTEFEQVTLSTDAVGTSLAHGALVNAHGGNATTRVQADIVNTTRNILISSSSTTFRSNIQMFAVSVTSFYYTKFQDLGTSTTTSSGISVATLTLGLGSFDFQYNVVIGTPGLTTSANSGMYTVSDTATTISNNIFYKLGWTTITTIMSIFGINNGNYIIGCLSLNANITCTYMGNDNVMTSNSGYNLCGFYNNATNNSFYSNGSYGLYIGISTANTIGNTGMNNFKIWRNNLNGILQNSNGPNNRTAIMSFDNIYVFGNTNTNINNGGRTYSKLLFTNSYFYGGDTLVAPSCVTFGNPNIPQDAIYFNNCYFGYSDSNLTSSPFSTSTLQAAIGHSINFNNCYFNPLPVEAVWTAGANIGTSTTSIQTSLVSTKHNGVTGSNKYWHSNGTITTDATIFNNASPSLRLIPISATYKLSTTTVKVPVKSGQTCSVSVKVRKSITADGVIYIGTAPRLIYAFSPLLGNMLETIGASYLSPTPTNLLQFPQNYEQPAWGKINATLALGATAAPDATLSATQITNTTSTFIRCNQTVTITPGSAYTYSSYIKQGNFQYVQVLVGNTGETLSNVIQYDFTANTITALNQIVQYPASNLSCISVGNGWFRMSFTITPPVGQSASLKFSGPCASSGFVSTITGNFCYIWGSKLELGSTATPYVTDGGVWQTLSYTTPAVTNDGVAEFYVDCDGTTGWINVDDWSTTTYNDTRGTGFWGNSSVYVEGDYKQPGASYTFFN